MTNPIPLLIAGLALLIALAIGSEPSRTPDGRQCVPGRLQSTPMVDLAPSLRQRNWWAGSGSCVYATTASLFRIVGDYKSADYVRAHFGGGAGPQDIRRVCESRGCKFLQTTDGDERLLNWAVETRRGCGLGFPAFHCTALVGRVDGMAVICDNNHTDKYTRIPWDEFLRKWKSCPPEGGWAFAIISDNLKPLPSPPSL
jgi:hypothetical protein